MLHGPGVQGDAHVGEGCGGQKEPGGVGGLTADTEVVGVVPLVVAAGIGVLAGGFISHYVSEKALHYVAGIGFIAIGVWTVLKA